MKQYKYITNDKFQRVRKDVQEVFDILKKYYDMMEDGTHAMVIPNPFSSVSEEQANRIVESIDTDIKDNESWRIRNRAVDKLPEFFRLSTGARIAMCEEILDLLKFQNEHIDEYLTELYC